MKAYFVSGKEDYRLTLLLATLFHLVLFSALFLTLRYSKPLFLSAAAPSAIIHATAMASIPLPKSVSVAKEPIKIPVEIDDRFVKPILMEKSPVALPMKEKKRVRKQINTTPRLKTAVISQKKQTVKRVRTKLEEKAKNVNPSLSVKSMQIAQKNVQQLLQREVNIAMKNNQMAMRNVATTMKYRHLILQSIAQQWIIPPDLDKHLETRLAVRLAPGGMVLDVIIIKGSGNTVLDRSAQTAVYKASPLPVPRENGLFNSFRQINLTVRPEGFIS
jgi:colicin import membrane protein